MGERPIRVETNVGIISTGDHAQINQVVYRASEGGVPSADQVACPAATVHLGIDSLAAGLFVGRDDELRQLDAVLASGAGVVTQVLTGLGGIGKSTLAGEYARRHRGVFNPGASDVARRWNRVAGNAAASPATRGRGKYARQTPVSARGFARLAVDLPDQDWRAGSRGARSRNESVHAA